MYEFVETGERTYYLDGPSKIGFYRFNENEICLIDSGINEESGRQALNVLNERGWALKMIINTHSHADHVGGNKFLSERTGCRIRAVGEDAAIIRNSILNTSLLYGGQPCADMKNKLLFAPSSDAQEMEDSDLPEGLEITRLDGHSFAMIGVKTPDDVWFLADSLTSRATLEKFHIPFLRDITNHLKTLLKVELLEGTLFIPSHVNPMKDVSHLVEINRSKILEIIDKILSICKTPSSTEDVLKDLFDSYRLVMDINQYMLAGCSVRSFLSHLHGSGEIRLSFSDNRLMWETA